MGISRRLRKYNPEHKGFFEITDENYEAVMSVPEIFEIDCPRCDSRIRIPIQEENVDWQTRFNEMEKMYCEARDRFDRLFMEYTHVCAMYQELKNKKEEKKSDNDIYNNTLQITGG